MKDKRKKNKRYQDPDVLKLFSKHTKVTEKLRNALEEGKLGQRLSHLSLRRFDGSEVFNNDLRKAYYKKHEKYKETGIPVNGPLAPGCNWLSVGPRNINGRIKCMAVHPTDGDTIYAGSAAGGVWKSEDRGQSWTPTMHDEASMAIGALAIDPNDSDTIYAGTGEPVYYFTGTLPPISSNLAWYYAGAGVYRSTDAGGTWTQLGALENDFIYGIAVDPNDSNNILCAGFSYTAATGGLCRSTDGGASWNTLTNGIFTSVLFDPNNAGVAYVAQFNGGVLKSTDNGATWTPKNTGLPAVTSMGRISLDIARSNSQVLYIKVENDASGSLLGVYRTATAAEGPGAWSVVTSPNVDGGFLWWCSYIKADPSDATGDTVIAGGVNIARSTNGGSTWQRITDAYGGLQPATHPDQHDVVYDPNDTSKFYAANDGGVFHGSYTGGAPLTDWTKVSTGLTVTQFYDIHVSKASPTMFGGGTQDNGSMISTGGLSWRNVYGADGGYAAFHPTDPYTVYMQTQSSLLKSTDGANNFAFSGNGISGSGTFPARVLAIDESTPTTLFTGRSSVFRTTNGGTNWNPASGNIGIVTEIAIAPSSSAVIYAGTINGDLYRATDGGATATSFGDITPIVAGWPTRWLSGIQVDPADSNIVYVCFMGFNNSVGNNSDHIWKGEFDGLVWTWAQISSGIPDVPVGAIVKHSTTSDLYIGTDIGVFRSQDDGVSWLPFEQGLPNVPVVDLHLDETTDTLRAATHGRGMYRIKLSGACPDVDLYLRDNILDTGEVTPSPSGIPNPTEVGQVVRFYKSADIKVDAQPFNAVDALLDGVEFDDPDHPFAAAYIESIDGIEHNQPIRTEVNQVYVQLHNRGWQVANSVTVKLLWADAGAGLPALPADYWTAFPGDGFDQTNWQPIGTTTITDLLPNTPQVVSFPWTPPMAVSTHVCLLAMLDSPQDPLLPQVLTNVDSLTRNNKKITHRNTHPVDPASPGGGPAWFAVNFNNALREHQFYRFEIQPMTGKSPVTRILIPVADPECFEQIELEGLYPIKYPKSELRRDLKRALKYQLITKDDAKLILGAKEVLAFETKMSEYNTSLNRVLLPPFGKIRAFFLQNTENYEEPYSFEVNQYHKDQLIGGSEFVVKHTKTQNDDDGKYKQEVKKYF